MVADIPSADSVGLRQTGAVPAVVGLVAFVAASAVVPVVAAPVVAAYQAEVHRNRAGDRQSAFGAAKRTN